MYVAADTCGKNFFRKTARRFTLIQHNTMPLSGNNIYYTSVITNVPELKTDSQSLVLKKQMISLVRKIQADTFWNTQVSQVVVDSAGMFELVPVLGDQRIIFGDVSNMNEKFNNLFAFYKNVLNHIGWDKYETLDLRFKDQVIASPSLPYKGPVDKAVVNMNWINSIVESEAKKEENDSLRKITAKCPAAAVPAKAATQSHTPAKKGILHYRSANRCYMAPQKSRQSQQAKESERNNR